jgi:hypothetical protein
MFSSNSISNVASDVPLRRSFLSRRDCREVDDKGFTLMTPQYLVQLCKEQKGYVTPKLNDVLYLHYKGFSRVSDALRAYTGLKSLWLENNALSELDHLGTKIYSTPLYFFFSSI